VTIGVDARDDARDLLGGRYGVRVLEPSPPARREAPWFADDPVNAAVDGGRPVVSPIPNGDHTWDELAGDDPSIATWCADHWLGAWRPLVPVTDRPALVRTRAAWHAVAERVLAPARRASDGHIGLRFTSGGFGTPYFASAGESVQLRVDGTELLIVRAGARHTVARVSLHDATQASPELDPALVSPRTPVELGYHTTTSLTADVVGVADDTSAAVLGDWFGFGCSVLEAVRAGAPDSRATRCQLWPEHFDLAVELGDEAAGGRAAYGASPGDGAHPEPYLYVSPWSEPPTDPHWNDTSFPGASLPYSSLTGDPVAARAAALEFFGTARRLLARD